ncbi:hypothetical protein KY284_013893 [Solanum tuberosum]|nr:hypothetical protein KY284_013893 [Solanum tuberosum]
MTESSLGLDFAGGEGDGVLFGDWLFAGFVVAFLEVVSVVFWVGVMLVVGGCFSWKWLRNGSLMILWSVSGDLELKSSLEMEKMGEQRGLVVRCCSLVNLEVTGGSMEVETMGFCIGVEFGGISPKKEKMNEGVLGCRRLAGIRGGGCLCAKK